VALGNENLQAIRKPILINCGQLEVTWRAEFRDVAVGNCFGERFRRSEWEDFEAVDPAG